ncbi:ABC transporter permease [Verminephrobacter eiseniae]|uniref:Binding-protein-dependent transport systems inner membrane component n=1 Tax=Verminephrobacter eiseniae (strain EF01-2) TaxID=391735 RepID=A1WG08_VEREI|nr:ABC transporter permease [Verminephrobacter eiseniae]ABM56565.1 binding-protein-dependent transport systems inner membrane component [Verminephrobacter eiseniae EF01-2]MCW5286922.1 ABC transporter permease [Verminephrobacter eiseniae]MCW5305220.1 ABC transporter permease [Verminephrobacter eiseniae]MCW8181300.1 ABC transporter permease [Verminephrobacter eiseniae]MCW8189484.1 ABC transporter permease [Verminephrobacter eiseniae]
MSAARPAGAHTAAEGEGAPASAAATGLATGPWAPHGWRQGHLAALLLLPIALINVIGFILPMLSLARYSFNEARLGGEIASVFTWKNWAGVLSDPFYLELVFDSAWISLAITLATLLLSYPIALYLHRASGAWRTFLSVLVISPLLTSAVVRTYGWIALLTDDGPVRAVISALGLPAPSLMFNIKGVFIGLTEILMPYMILSLMAGFGRLDPRIEEAARTLGASPARTFRSVILPLTLPGMALGCLLCFVLAVSSFITPNLMGGGRVFLLATEIYDQAIVTLNWPLASTLSLLVLIVFGAALWVYSVVLKQLD